MKKTLVTISALFIVMSLQGVVSAAPTLTFSDYSDGIKTLNESYGGNTASPTIYDYFEVSLNEEPVTENNKIKVTSSQCFFWGDREGYLGQSYSTLVGPATGGSYSNGKTLRTAVVALDDSSYEGTHTCTVTAVVISADPNFSGLSASKTFNINDNDTKPQETTTPTDTTTQNNPTSSNAQTANQEVNNEDDEEKPTVTEVSMSDLSGNVKQKNDEGKYAYENGNPIIIRGKTVPSGVVKLYIFSEPQEATVTADENGNWEYTIESIEPGDHRVEVEVTDPATGDTSERTEVLAFAVAQASEAENVTLVTELTPVEDNSSLLPIVVIAVVLLAVGAGGGYWFWRKKHTNVESQVNTSAETNPQPSIVNEVADNPEPKIDDNR